MTKVLSLVGTRPEAIKMAPVLKELDRRAGEVESVLCVTGQHREMLDQVMATFRLVPDYDLDVMADNQSPAEVTGAVLRKLGPILEHERPDWVLVQGDTTSVMSGALAAFYAGVKVGHVEAGLRTYNVRHPFPEEANRRMVTVVTDLHFAPTPASRANLLREGVPPERIVLTGNPVIDALHAALQMPYADSGILATIPWPRRVLLVTAHRRESWGEPLESICHALADIARAHDDVHIVYSTHLNPNVHEPVTELLGGIDGITLTPPLGYLELVHLLWRSTLVLTDSGGIQEEAPALGKPVLVLREETERPEAVEAGVARVVGTDRFAIVDAVSRLLDDPARYAAMAHAVSPYGDGRAAARIVDGLLSFDEESAADPAVADSLWS